MIVYNSMQQGYVHSVETGGMVDGPGIRYVVFLSGCSLRCKYCHNPDTWKRNDGRLMTVNEVIRDIKKYRSYLKFSGGGVTITGGEPFVQPDFLVELLAACRAYGLHTALDTSGHGTGYLVESALQYTDLLLLDIKSINPEVYKNLTGVSIERTLEMLWLSNSLNIPTWVRYVLVPGYTDDFDDIKKLADFLRPFTNVKKIEVLPFHKLGEHKWENMDTPYELADVEPPGREVLKKAKAILEK